MGTDRSHPAFEFHVGGKIGTEITRPVETRADLSLAYTPGVGLVSEEIAADPSAVWEYTGRGNAVAVVTDGSAVLGLGDLGPEGAMPVMEGKAVLFKHFAGIDAYPICLDAREPDDIISVVKALAPTFGGINLEDISAPRCFEIEGRLAEELDIPVFHDDQHGTAIVSQAALFNAAKLVGKRLEDLSVTIMGIGAAGVAIAKLLMHLGVHDIVGVDRSGSIYKGRKQNMNGQKRWFANRTNPQGIAGGIDDALVDRDVFIGVSGPGLVKPEWIENMSSDAIVFAMANPVPEIMPEEVPANVAVMATGRSDYPNQINNVLAFPGVFRGLLDVRARRVDNDMKVAAARAIAATIPEADLAPELVIPSVFDRAVVPVVAEAVRSVARQKGLARI
ncbi:MAG: NADP-dependent malic enzyme [Acidimicrobiia bacterium]|nr:NADP-dependent malic enzyme [Acidimicrobiia bacterium]